MEETYLEPMAAVPFDDQTQVQAEATDKAFTKPLTTTLPGYTEPKAEEEQPAEEAPSPEKQLGVYNEIVARLGANAKLKKLKKPEELTSDLMDKAKSAYTENINSSMKMFGYKGEPFKDLESVDWDIVKQTQDKHNVDEFNKKLKALKTKSKIFEGVSYVTNADDLESKYNDLNIKAKELNSQQEVSNYNAYAKDLKDNNGISIPVVKNISELPAAKVKAQKIIDAYNSAIPKYKPLEFPISSLPGGARGDIQAPNLETEPNWQKKIAEYQKASVKMYREQEANENYIKMTSLGLSPETIQLVVNKNMGHPFSYQITEPNETKTEAYYKGASSKIQEDVSKIDKDIKDKFSNIQSYFLSGAPVSQEQKDSALKEWEDLLKTRRILVNSQYNFAQSLFEERSKRGNALTAGLYSGLSSIFHMGEGLALTYNSWLTSMSELTGEKEAEDAFKSINEDIHKEFKNIDKGMEFLFNQTPENIEHNHPYAGFIGSTAPYLYGGLTKAAVMTMMFGSNFSSNYEKYKELPSTEAFLRNGAQSLVSAWIFSRGLDLMKGHQKIESIITGAIMNMPKPIKLSGIAPALDKAFSLGGNVTKSAVAGGISFSGLNMATEISRSVIDNLGNVISKNQVDAPDFAHTVANALESGAKGWEDGPILALITAPYVAYKTGKMNRETFERALSVRDQRMMSANINKIKQAVADGIISKETGKEYIDGLIDLRKNIMQIPEDMAPNHAYEAWKLLNENKQLEYNASGLNDAFKDPILAKIKENNNKIKELGMMQDQAHQHEKEGATSFLKKRNLMGLEASSVSMFPERDVTIEGPLTQEHIDNFEKNNQDLLAGNEDILSIDTWKDKDGKSRIGISAITTHADAKELGRIHELENVYNLENNKEIPTGATRSAEFKGKSEADRIKDIREFSGRTKASEADYKPVGLAEVTARLGENNPMIRAVRNAMTASPEFNNDKNTLKFNFHDDNASMQHALNIRKAAHRDAKGTRGNFWYQKNKNGGWDIVIDVNLKSGADDETIRHETTHAIFLHTLGENSSAFKAMKDAFSNYGNMFNDSALIKFSDMYDKSDSAEEYLAELSAIRKNIKPGTLSKIAEFINEVAKKFLGDKFVPFKNVNDANEIIRYLGSLAEAVRTGKPSEAKKPRFLETEKFAEEAKMPTTEAGKVSESDIEAAENGLSVNVGDPTVINKIDAKSKPRLVFPKKPHALSFVTDKDMVDIDEIMKDIYDNNKTVWIWMADQLGRGSYYDEVIQGDHYLDAGPSFALDPKNKNKGVLWASGLSEKYLAESAEKADYIFFISGSPEKAKMFNKSVLDLVGKRIDSKIGFEKFKKGINKFGKKTDVLSTMIDILNKHKSFNDIINSSDRKPFLLAIDEVRKLKTAPKGSLKEFLLKSEAIIDPNKLRDGFYKENNFEQNDIMLIGRPSGAKKGSEHGTYLNSVLGEVIGVPNKKINAWELMPDEIKQKYPKATTPQKAKVLAAEMGQFFEGREGELRAKSKQRLTETERELLPIRDGWYSGIEKRMISEKADKQTAAKWLAGPVIGKGDEAVYTGLRQWLESKNPQEQVSKKDISDFMKDNRVEIKEITKESNLPKSYFEIQKTVEELNDAGFGIDFTEKPIVEGDLKDFITSDLKSVDMSAYDPEYYTKYTKEEYEQYAKKAVDAVALYRNSDFSEKDGVETQYHDYQLPGESSDYKEVLVVLPREGQMNKVEDYEVPRAHRYGEDLSDKRRLVHLRMNTRTDADGNKVLFLEEIQSDWGQTGKKEGFDRPQAEREAALAKRNAIIHSISNLLEERSRVVLEEKELFDNTKRFIEISNEISEKETELSKLSEIAYSQGTPPAPFVTDTKQWTKLGLKMAIKEAIRQGVNKLAWTTGEQQNERYNLSNVIDNITVQNDGLHKDGYTIYRVKSEYKNGEEAYGYYKAEELPSVLGKDLADKILADNIQKGEKEKYEGIDLAVGGSGMKGFYDKIVPDAAKSLVKELTGKDAEITEVKLKEGTTQQAIDITPELKESVEEGMPMFSKQQLGDEEKLQRTTGGFTYDDAVKELKSMLDSDEKFLVSDTEKEESIGNIMDNIFLNSLKDKRETQKITNVQGLANAMYDAAKENWNEIKDEYISHNEYQEAMAAIRLAKDIKESPKEYSDVLKAIAYKLKLPDWVEKQFKGVSPYEGEPKSKQQLTEEGEKFMNDMQRFFKNNERRGTKEDIVERAIADAEKKWPKWIRENQEEYNARVIQFKESKGIKIPKAPSQERISGQKPKKVIVNEAAALKDQIRLEAKAAREGAMDVKKFFRSVSEGVNLMLRGMIKNQVISVKQSASILKNLARLNPNNQATLDNFYKRVDRIFEDADYEDKLKNARSSRKKIKSAKDSKSIPLTLRNLAERFAKINPSEVDNIDKYNEMVELFNQATKRSGSLVNDADGSKRYDTKEALDMAKMEEYIESHQDAVDEARVKREAAVEEDPEAIDKLKDEIGQFSDMAKELIETGISPIDGEAMDLTDKQKAIVKKFIEMTPNDKKTLIAMREALDHFVKNGDTGLMEFARERYDIERKTNAGVRALKRATAGGVKRLPIEGFVSGVRAFLRNIHPGYSIEHAKDYYYLSNNSLSRIDTLLRNLEKGSPVFKATFRDIAAGYSFYRTKTKEMDATKIWDNMLRSMNGNLEKAIIANYKITMYLRQLEHESNPGSKKSLPAMKYIEQVIEKSKSGKNNIDAKSRRVIEKLVENYSYTDADGVKHIDKNKIYDSFSNVEKTAITELQELYKSLLPYAKTVAEKIRNNPFNEIANYVSIAVNDMEAADLDLTATQMQGFLPSSVSTKAGQIEDRTGVARSIDMNPFTTANKAVRNVLLDYSITSPMTTLRKITEGFVEESKGSDDDVRLFAIALREISNEVVLTTLGRSFFERTVVSDAKDFATRAVTTYLLGTLSKVGAELGGNAAFTALYAPLEFTEGTTKYGDYLFHGKGGKVLEVLGSYTLDRLFPHGGDMGKIIDPESFDVSVSGSQGVPSTSRKLATQAYYRIINKALKAGKAVGEGLLTTPDLAIARPIWFGTMALEFKKATGKAIDFEKIANEDMEYIEANRRALENARDIADQKVTEAASTKNPFLQSPRLTKASRSGKVIISAQNYLSGFTRKEFEVATDAFDRLYRDGQGSKIQAAKTLAAVAARAGTYTMLQVLIGNLLTSAGHNLSQLLFGNDDEDELSAAMKKGLKGGDFEEAARREKEYLTTNQPKMEGVDPSISASNFMMTGDEWAVEKMNQRIKPKSTAAEAFLHGIAKQGANFILNRNFGNLQNTIQGTLFEEYINKKYLNTKDYDKFRDSYFNSLIDSEGKFDEDVMAKVMGAPGVPVAGAINMSKAIIFDILKTNDKIKEVDETLDKIHKGIPVKEYTLKDTTMLTKRRERLIDQSNQAKRKVVHQAIVAGAAATTAIPSLRDMTRIATRAAEDMIIKTYDWDELLAKYKYLKEESPKGRYITPMKPKLMNRTPMESSIHSMERKGYKLTKQGWVAED